ncbi:hypothetical protein [Klebsiella quasipneumoniae]|uniref:hypothetical protein n=1 Tax=Klebsiella quasipneumoniae TaxID=1463165 RepID=UPI00388EA1D5
MNSQKNSQVLFWKYGLTTIFKRKRKNKISLRAMLENTHGLYSALTKIFFLSIIIESINLVMPVATQLVMDHAIPANDSGLLTLICFGLVGDAANLLI